MVFRLIGSYLIWAPVLKSHTYRLLLASLYLRNDLLVLNVDDIDETRDVLEAISRIFWVFSIVFGCVC